LVAGSGKYPAGLGYVLPATVEKAYLASALTSQEPGTWSPGVYWRYEDKKGGNGVSLGGELSLPAPAAVAGWSGEPIRPRKEAGRRFRPAGWSSVAVPR